LHGHSSGEMMRAIEGYADCSAARCFVSGIPLCGKRRLAAGA
jgi:hypothetical protein